MRAAYLGEARRLTPQCRKVRAAVRARRRRICIRASSPGATRSRGTRKRCACSSARRSRSAALAVLTIAAELALKAGARRRLALAGEIVAPLVACGLIYAAAAADRGASAVAAASRSRRFARAAGAIAAIVVGERSSPSPRRRSPRGGSPTPTCSSPTGMARASTAGACSASTRSGIARVAAGDVRSVPRAVRARAAARGVRGELESPSRRTRCRSSSTARRRSCCSASACSRAGLGLVLALPLWAASAYAAWKDIFGVRDAPQRGAEATRVGHAGGPVREADDAPDPRRIGRRRRRASTRAAGGPRRHHAIDRARPLAASPCTSASTVPSRRLRTQPVTPQRARRLDHRVADSRRPARGRG